MSASGVSPTMSSSGSPGTPQVYTGVQGQNLLARLESVMTPGTAPNRIPDTPMEQGELKQVSLTSEEEATGAEGADGEEAESVDGEDHEDAKSVDISEEEDNINEMVQTYVTNTGGRKDRKRTARRRLQH